MYLISIIYIAQLCIGALDQSPYKVENLGLFTTGAGRQVSWERMHVAEEAIPNRGTHD